MGYAKRKTAKPSVNAGGSAALSSRATSPSSGQGSIWSMQIGGSTQKTVMKRLEVLLFTSELADLIEAGMTLGQALQALANQAEEGSAQKYVCQNI